MKCALLATACSLGFAVASVHADDAEALAGKWSVKKTNDQGQTYTQTIEIKKDKFVFEIKDSDNQLVIHAEGDFKLAKLGPFNSIRFLHIRGGSSATDLSDVDDEYTSIYVLDGDTWKMTMNFDKERDQKPTVDVMHRAGQGGGQAGALVIDSIEMADTPQGGTWYFCFDATLGAVTKRYHVENKGFDKNQVSIPVALEIPLAKAGQKCSFKMQLDDVAGDECADDVDNSSKGEFTVSEKGSQTFKPEEHWSYTVKWHLK